VLSLVTNPGFGIISAVQYIAAPSAKRIDCSFLIRNFQGVVVEFLGTS